MGRTPRTGKRGMDHMKTSELEKFIQGLTNDLYSMAFVMIPDDLQASQLMIDSVQAFLLQKNTLLQKWEDDLLIADEEKKEMCKKHILKCIYELSKKRYVQLKMSLKDVEDSSGFFSLELDEKAALYLKERAHFDLLDCEFILSKSKSEVLAYLYSARLKMAEKMNTVMALDTVMQQQGN